MKVILLKDVPNVGKKYDVKEVKLGYYRNFLLPHDLAKPATKNALAWLETQKEIQEKKSEDELKTAQDTASRLDGVEVVIPVKLGKENQLYESISTSKIAEKLKETGFEVKKSQIELERPIKELGEYQIKVKMDHNLESTIRLIITEEKEI